LKSDLEKHALVVVSDVSTSAGHDNSGTKPRDPLVQALPCKTKLLKGRIDLVLCLGHAALEELLYSRPGMIGFWVPQAGLVQRCGSVTD
jgi:hypothetical protein